MTTFYAPSTARSLFMQPRPPRCRLDAGPSADARRAMYYLRRTLSETGPATKQILALVEARQSSRIENVYDEPTPEGADLASRLYQATQRAVAQNLDLRDAHRMLWADRSANDPVQPGRFRDCQVYVGNHIPPIPALVPGLMAEFTLWARQERDPLIRAVWGHAWFETIHPFADGNGRAGRLWMLQQLRMPELTLSRSIYRRRAEYYAGLAQGQWQPWQQYLLEIIAEAAAETAQDLRRLQNTPSDRKENLSRTVALLGERKMAPAPGTDT